MMNELKIFESPVFGQVRIVEREGEPWFVGKDVAQVLGYANPSKAILDHVDDEDKAFQMLEVADSQNGNLVKTAIITESGLYSLVLSSKLPTAKAFKRWITSEVIPSIRKNGGYIAGQAELSPEELMARALMVAQRTLAERDARISALTVENEVMRPKAGYFDDMVDRKLNTGIRETAKELSVKEKTFVTFLLEGKYLYRDQKKKLQPYAQYVDDLFVLKECFNEKTNWSGTQLLITPKGRETFRLLCQGI